jgi:hypothetical protein
MGRISHILWKNKKNVPNHQPVLGPRPVNRCLEMQTPRKKTRTTTSTPQIILILDLHCQKSSWQVPRFSISRGRNRNAHHQSHQSRPPLWPLGDAVRTRQSIDLTPHELLLTWSQFHECQQKRFRCISRFLAASGLVPTEISCSWPHLPPQKDAYEACDTCWAWGLVNCRPPAWAHWPCDFATRG